MDYTTSYRIKFFTGGNKLYENYPIFDTIYPDEYKYYWFVSVQGIPAFNTGDWAHYLGVGIKTIDADVDMYVSVFDGRMPTKEDHDFKSTKLGADVIKLDSTDPYFQRDNTAALHPEDGLVVVVGIYNPSDINVKFSVVEKLDDND